MILELIYLATASGIVGGIITFILLITCYVLNVDLGSNLWLLAIPALSAVVLNIILLEIFRKRKGKNQWGGGKHF
jgi:hypothetical protein